MGSTPLAPHLQLQSSPDHLCQSIYGPPDRGCYSNALTKHKQEKGTSVNLITTSERWIFSGALLVLHERPGRGCSDLQGYIPTVWVSISIIISGSFCVAMEPSFSQLVFSDSQYSFGYSGFWKHQGTAARAAHQSPPGEKAVPHIRHPRPPSLGKLGQLAKSALAALGCDHGKRNPSIFRAATLLHF